MKNHWKKFTDPNAITVNKHFNRLHQNMNKRDIYLYSTIIKRQAFNNKNNNMISTKETYFNRYELNQGLN